ncbi:phage major capsid protein [Dietzia sp. 179-F 9C3 NHS]|uniref:phage major capsid protein n=1 Tax=Dietzia sp. 179-F 9C3 NHS TaxID=3374295 RepID=UPI00387A27A8
MLTNGSPILTPDQVQALVVEPTLAASIATSVCGVINTNSEVTRIPRITSDPTAEWVEEGAEIPTSNATADELVIVPAKVAALSVISNELANDTAPAAANIIGAGIVRDLVREVDAAFFGAKAAPAPSGLAALDGVTTTTGTLDDFDIFVDAIAAVQAAGGTVNAWVANPTDAATIAKIKTSAGSNMTALSGDPSTPGRRVIEGAPLYVTPEVAAGTIWTLDATSAQIVLRNDAEVAIDRSVYFTSDRCAVRGTLRIGWGFTRPASIGKITIT